MEAAGNKRPQTSEGDEQVGSNAPNLGRNVGSDGSDDDDEMGPRLPAEAPLKKRRVLPYEKVYTSALPRSTRYSRSLMHKEPVLFVTMTPYTDFLITTSSDGVIKFWKKVAEGIEFVKEYQAHQGDITSTSISADGRSFASAGADQTIKIFDVFTFDLLSTLTLTYVPSCLCWVHSKASLVPLLAIAEENRAVVHIHDGRFDQQEPIHTIRDMHRDPVTLISFNDAFDCALSVDKGGMVEYWRPSGSYEKPENVFSLKSGTGLFEFKKAKSVPYCVSMSPSGSHFATLSFPDRKVRVFDFPTAKLHRTYDESLPVMGEIQRTGPAGQMLDSIEFGRRMALEKELEAPMARKRSNIVFDESGHFILYGTMLGIKVVNTYTNQVVKIYGKDENFRATQLALYQGQPLKKGITTVEMGASSNPLLAESQARDPILVATGVGKVRFYMFTNEKDVSKSSRDVQNERPTVVSAKKVAQAKPAERGSAAILHTTYGDIHVRLFPDAAPKAVENFVTHARNGYYNNTIFHRVIRKFMIQAGDPLGDGTGGESIWGRDFEDEFSTLKHDKPYTLSMANAGTNTNASQFFITTEKTPWLNGKHTIFGRATQGLDVVHKIENVRTNKDKPLDDIKIVSIDVI